MPYYLLLGFGGLWAILFLRFNRRWLYQVAEQSVGVLNTMLSNLSDEEKLAILPKATGRLVFSLLVCIVLFALAAGIAYLPFGGSEYLFGPAPARPAWLEITALSIGASIPFFLPLRRGASNYSELSILLHRLVLNNPDLGQILMKREIKKRQKRGIKHREDFLIVSGLARAGTTSFMNHLAALPEFSSLSYANMPFLLSPNTWARFYKPKKTQEQERSHKDGIKIGLKSYEALEEYFFKSQARSAYIKELCLKEYRLSAKEAQSYLDYQSLVRESEAGIYLAKNNNFLLRYQSLREQNSAFRMVLLFREPLAHAASLLEKHLQYVELQKHDPFVLEYMNWLGHHEFGLGQKAFAFEGQQIPNGNPKDLDYWLAIWLNYYRRALEIEDDRIQFVAYDQFCKAPNEVLSKAIKPFGLQAGFELSPFSNSRQIEAPSESALLEEARALYQKLLAKVS